MSATARLRKQHSRQRLDNLYSHLGADLPPRYSELRDKFASMRKQSNPYTVVTEFFSPRECDQILQYSLDQQHVNTWEVINFDKKIKDRRRQLPIGVFNFPNPTYPENFPAHLREFISAIHTLHPHTSSISVKLLEADSGSQEQSIHTDNCRFTARIEKEKEFFNVPLVMLIALQPETSLITAKIGGDLSDKQKGKYSKTILKQGSFILLRGDAAHAGTEYTKLNYRLHLEIETAAHIFKDEKGFDQVGILTRRECKESDLLTTVPVKHSNNAKKRNAEEMSATTSRLEDVGDMVSSSLVDHAHDPQHLGGCVNGLRKRPTRTNRRLPRNLLDTYIL